MTRKTHLGDIMETCCPHCSSHFRITDKQLQAALGKVRCGECNLVFNALQSLQAFNGILPPDYRPPAEIKRQVSSKQDRFPKPELRSTSPELSLHEAMYGEGHSSFAQFAPFLWFIGILLLIVLGISQGIYYQRYQLIDNPRFQHQVLTLCKFVPCGETGFSSIRQIKLLERNVFTHPVTSNALMVTGSFVNQAPFPQKMPRMLVSLFDLKGKLIANRVFEPSEYLQTDKNRATLESGKPIQFRLEIVDPGTDALTYEFEFY
ncbi:MAG: DUF3426 domain-containing protein [Gammaproteobacteria bacterium]|nr:DUF3426 domain-containing protein [Gammaproteobacteria bacterium]